MAKVNDILLDETGDLKIVNGDIVIGESTNQHQRLMLLASKGNFKQVPLIGVGLIDYLNDENPGALKTEIRKQLTSDYQLIKRLEIVNGQINIEAIFK